MLINFIMSFKFGILGANWDLDRTDRSSGHTSV